VLTEARDYSIVQTIERVSRSAVASSSGAGVCGLGNDYRLLTEQARPCSKALRSTTRECSLRATTSASITTPSRILEMRHYMPSGCSIVAIQSSPVSEATALRSGGGHICRTATQSLVLGRPSVYPPTTRHLLDHMMESASHPINRYLSYR